MKINFSRKILLIIVLSSFLSVFIATTVVSFFSFREMRDNITEDIVMGTELVAQNASAAIAFNDNERISTLANSFIKTHSVSLVCFYDESFNIIFKLTKESLEDLECLKGFKGVFSRLQGAKYNVSTAVIQAGYTVGYIYIVADLKEVYSLRIKYIALILFSVISIVFLVSIPISLVILRFSDTFISNAFSKIGLLENDIKSGGFLKYNEENISFISHYINEHHERLSKQIAYLKKDRHMSLAMIMDQVGVNFTANKFALEYFVNHGNENIQSEEIAVLVANKNLTTKLQKTIKNMLELASEDESQGFFKESLFDLYEPIYAAYSDIEPLLENIEHLYRLDINKIIEVKTIRFALYAMSKFIFLLFDEVCLKKNEYKTSITLSEINGNVSILFSQKCLSSDHKPFTYDVSDYDLLLYNAKHYYNLLNTFIDQGFDISLSENEFAITTLIVKH